MSSSVNYLGFIIVVIGVLLIAISVSNTAIRYLGPKTITVTSTEFITKHFKTVEVITSVLTKVVPVTRVRTVTKELVSTVTKTEPIFSTVEVVRTVTKTVFTAVTLTETRTVVPKVGYLSSESVNYSGLLTPGSVIYVSPDRGVAEVLRVKLVNYSVVTSKHDFILECSNAKCSVINFGIDGQGIKAVLRPRGSEVVMRFKSFSTDITFLYLYAPGASVDTDYYLVNDSYVKLVRIYVNGSNYYLELMIHSPVGYVVTDDLEVTYVGNGWYAVVINASVEMLDGIAIRTVAPKGHEVGESPTTLVIDRLVMIKYLTPLRALLALKTYPPLKVINYIVKNAGPREGSMIVDTYWYVSFSTPKITKRIKVSYSVRVSSNVITEVKPLTNYVPLIPENDLRTYAQLLTKLPTKENLTITVTTG